MALKVIINGWYYPLVLQEHMDHPSSKHSMFHRYSFNEAYKHSYGFKYGNICKKQQYIAVHKEIIHNLLTSPYDPKCYTSWRGKLRWIIKRIKTKWINL
jgi:hypothetical protein